MEVERVVSVAPEHVGLDQIREDEAVVELTQQALGLRDPLDVRLRRMGLVDVLTGEDVPDLADAVDGHPGLANERQVIRAPRLEREVVAVRGPLVVPWIADEGTGDHAADSVLAREDLPRNPAGGYSRSAVADALGLLAMLVFIVCVIALAAAMTWLVVRFSPAKKPSEPSG